MRDEGGDNPRFYCDAMLGGLARWLRAAGYDTAYEYGIDDGVLVDRAGKQGRIVLSSDGPLFERTVIREGKVKALFIPRQTSKFEQLEYVMRQLSLPIRTPRCMGCGGELAEVPKSSVTGEAPPLAFRNCERFWRCGGCGKLLWHGTHWQRVRRHLQGLADTL